jgi:hypothetical protein
MDLPLYRDAILTQDLPAHGLKAGDVGTVVDRHDSQQGVGYSVEFFDMTGRTVAVVVVDEAKLRPPSANDLPTARSRGV